jgi:predicted phosphodiesterase
MQIMVLGDTHGNTPDAVRAVKHARRHGAKKIIQVGDFGLWDHFADGVTFLDTLNEALRAEGVKLYAVGGNHENWIRWNWYVDNNPKDQYGFTILRSHIRIAPKVFTWQWEDKKYAMAGGAVSIDSAWRRMEQEKPNTLWWEDEQLRDEDVAAIVPEKMDYLFTHDCSNATPWKRRLKPDFDSQIHRQRIDGVLAKWAPEIHFHGHMHEKYDWVNMVNTYVCGPYWTQTYGLECDGMFWKWGILDTETDTFDFAPSTVGIKS